MFVTTGFTHVLSTHPGSCKFWIYKSACIIFKINTKNAIKNIFPANVHKYASVITQQKFRFQKPDVVDILIRAFYRYTLTMAKFLQAVVGVYWRHRIACDFYVTGESRPYKYVGNETAKAWWCVAMTTEDTAAVTNERKMLRRAMS